MKRILKYFVLVTASGLIISSLLFFSYLKDLPRPENFTEKEVFQSTKIFDRSGQVLLYEIYGEEKRTVVSLGQISDFLKKAVIVAEDADFYSHRGISLKALLRAVLVDLRVLTPLQGASTISQQLVRSSYLGREKTSARKTREIVLALELERRYAKEQILEFYLNQIPFGQNAYGAEAASQVYFQKSAQDLTLAQAAALASLIRAPSRRSPYGSNKQELLTGKDYILQRMQELGFIGQDQMVSAQKEVLEFAKISQSLKAPHFTVWVKEILEDKFGEDFLKEKGLRVYTTLDWQLQAAAEKIVEQRAKANESWRAFNAALVAIDPQSGEILSLVGSKDFFADPYPKNCSPGLNCLFEPQFNVALASRQPGSAFKPFVYATAFNKGYDDKTLVVDEPTSFGVWGGEEYRPSNYDNKFRGQVTLRQALAQSLNIPSIKTLLFLAGIDDSVKTARDLGLTTLKEPFGPAMVLGGQETKPLEMVSAYAVFAAEGVRFPPTPILKIEDTQGNLLEEYRPIGRRVLEKEVADLVTSILSDNQARAPVLGLRSPLFFENYENQVAVKTGTTQDFKDGWTIGYAKNLALGVWTGNNDNSSMAKEPGVVLAGPIFHELMLKALAAFPLNP
jgi:membrane peptidoglycan carboxypeptidase